MNVQQIEIPMIYGNEMSFDRLIVSDEIFRNVMSALQRDTTVTIASIKFETNLKVHNTEVIKYLIKVNVIYFTDLAKDI